MKLLLPFKRKKNINIEEELEKEVSDTEYRKLAEAVLTRFGVKNVQNLTDEKLLEEFSKLPHPNTIWDTSVSFPSGSTLKSKPLDRVDGIIMAAWFAPDFVKTVISDREFLDIWKRERQKKIENSENSINTVSSDKILNLLLEIDDEYYSMINKEDKNIKVLNIIKLLEVLDQKYREFIKESYDISVPSFLEILNTFAMSIEIDSLGDLLALTEQRIEEGEKITYVELEEEETVELEDIIAQFEDDEDEIDEDENDEGDDDSDDGGSINEDDLFGDDDINF